MIPRLDISFPINRQWQYCFGLEYDPHEGEFLLNHARSGIVMALRSALPHGGRVGVVTYNCHTVMNAVVSAGCSPVFVDVDDNLKLIVDENIELDAIVVTNLFGTRNDVAAIRKVLPNVVIIIDNAHGYGLPHEGDFTVYSINQGKYPALGEGGLLVVSNSRYLTAIQKQYDQLSGYNAFGFWKLFVAMMVKALMYRPWFYRLVTIRLKAGRQNDADHTTIMPRKMCKGVSRMYCAWTSARSGESLVKPFMDIVRTNNTDKVIAQYRMEGIEAETHFKNCIRWAKEFGYVEGSCPNAERLVHQLVMVPNYFKNK